MNKIFRCDNVSSPCPPGVCFSQKEHTDSNNNKADGRQNGGEQVTLAGSGAWSPKIAMTFVWLNFNWTEIKMERDAKGGINNHEVIDTLALEGQQEVLPDPSLVK